MAKLGKFVQKLFGPNADEASDDPNKLEQVLDTVARERAQALDAIRATIPARTQALLDDDAAAIDVHDKESDRLHRIIERADLVAEQLEPRLHAARERQFQQMKSEAISRNRSAIEASFQSLHVALANAAELHQATAETYEKALAELRTYGCANEATDIRYDGLVFPEHIETWRGAVEKQLNPKPVEPRDLRSVTFVKGHRCYAPAEVAAFPPSEAAALVDRGIAIWADPRPRPRPPAPELSDDGDIVPVRFRRSTWWKGTPYNEGEIAGFPSAFARQLVSSGSAEPVMPEPSPLGPSVVATPVTSAPSAGPAGGLQQRGE